MVHPRGYNHQHESNPFLYHDEDDDDNDDSYLSTAYHGAGCNLELPPAARLDHNGFENIRLTDRPRSSQPAREGLGSRFLSSLSNAQPTAAALSRSGSVLHTRAKSWAVNVSKLNPSSTSTSIPEKPQPSQRNKFFSGLFDGESARVQLGVPTSPEKEKEVSEFVMEYRPVLTERPASSQIRRASTIIDTPPSKNHGTRKATWFARKPPMPAAPVVKIEDEMLTLNINNGLFPHGPADPLSPHAFNDLLLNASSLLQRMQAAYKEKVEYIASIQPELDAQKEEVEEARTRSEHLKMQLEDIGRQNQEQRQVNEELLSQLSQERLKFQETLESAPKTTVRLVRPPPTTTTTSSSSASSPHRNRKRNSNSTASDSGFESDAETSSLFSSSNGNPVPKKNSQTDTQQQQQQQEGRETKLEVPTSTAMRESRAEQFERSSRRSYCYCHCETEEEEEEEEGEEEEEEDSTARMRVEYKGTRPRARDNDTREWGTTLEKLREENWELRGRVEEMRRGLEGCIEFVEGIGGA